MLIHRFLLALDQQGLPLPGEAATRWMSFGDMFSDLAGARSRKEWPPAQLAPLFALAQHHGIPTRLLDWTERPYVAAYFAALGGAELLSRGASPNDMIAVWGLEYPRARAILMKDLMTQSQPSLQLVRAPRHSNPNLRAQEGVFTVLMDTTRGSDDKAASLALDEIVVQRFRERFDEGKPLVPPVLRKFELPLSETGKLLRLLADEGVSGTHLYPGVDGVVRGLTEHAFWDTEPLP